MQHSQSGRKKKMKNNMKKDKTLAEAIVTENDLMSKLVPIPEADIMAFMGGLRGGTYFNMGMYSSIPVAMTYKSAFRLYKVVEMTAIVSGIGYENIAAVKDFRDQTGKGPGKSWYNHVPGYENKVGQSKADESKKYILWDIKKGSGTNVRYYLVDVATGAVTPVTKNAVMSSNYLTQSEKNKLMPSRPVGFSQAAGEFVQNQVNWRTAAFEHVFWLSQNGGSTAEYGARFVEDLADAAGELFVDGNPNAADDLDALISAPSGDELDLEF